MTPLQLLSTNISDKLHVKFRTLDPSEILRLESNFLNTDNPIRKMITFPLPVPRWSLQSMIADCKVQTWSWEREGNITLLVLLPVEIQGNILKGKVSYLNNQADNAGKFYVAEDDRVYYQFSQTIFCKGEVEDDGRVVNIHQAKAAKEAANHLILYSIGNVVADLSRILHLVGADCIRLDGAGGWLDVEF